VRHDAFDVDPWRIQETRLDLDVLAHTESVFALSNGHIGMRGNLDEGEPHGLPGMYLNSVYELRPLPYAEAGYGYPESGQSIVNITNGKIVRLLVDDEPFDVRYGTLDEHERVLDLQHGRLTRTVLWRSPVGSSVRIRSDRMVSLSQRSVAAIHYEVEAVGQPLRIVLQSELVANEPVPPGGKDPRVAAVLEAPLESEEYVVDELGAVLVHRTKQSGLRIAAAMDHEIDGPDETLTDVDAFPDVARLTVATRLQPGQKLRLVKYLAYGWSSRRSRSALHDQVAAAIAGARLTGWDGLCTEQCDFLQEYWEGADVEVEGDAEIQQAVRFAMFHVLQAGARAEQRPIAAKGLTGTGYDGHTFWDTESYVLPVLIFTYPQAAAHALAWRGLTLPLAIERAKQLNLEGAAFPWRTIRGQECSAYWPAGTAAFHINAGVADAVVRYLDATDDREFEEVNGVELLVHTARLWRSLGHHDLEGRFRIDGVTGPDEYSAIADNNVYTNLMARQNLVCAAEISLRNRDRAAALGVTIEEAASWRDAATNMFIPYDERLGVHPQSEGFTDHARWDFESTPEGHYPLLLHYPYFELYRMQVVKQADLVLAMARFPDAFTDDEKLRNFTYYEALTVRDSSLSAPVQAVMAAEVGLLDLAYDYLAESALVDLHDLKLNSRDGLHLASLAGAWTALVGGFGGMRAVDGRLRFAPRLPGGITKLRFRVQYKGRRIRVTVTASSVSYELLTGEPIEIDHHGVRHLLDGAGFEQPIPTHVVPPAPKQPFGRAPRPHDPHERH
jgi:alpha,alpha-trehalose phosphorylase